MGMVQVGARTINGVFFCRCDYYGKSRYRSRSGSF